MPRNAGDDVLVRVEIAAPPSIVRSGPLTHSHGHVVFDWNIVGPDGRTFVTGFNVGELDAAGQFRSMLGFQRTHPLHEFRIK